MPDRLKLLLEYLEESPQDPFLLFALAQEFIGLQDYLTALSTFMQLRETNPEYIGLYYHMGKLQQFLGKEDDAIATFEDGIQRAKTHGEMHALSELTAALMELKDP